MISKWDLNCLNNIYSWFETISSIDTIITDTGNDKHTIRCTITQLNVSLGLMSLTGELQCKTRAPIYHEFHKDCAKIILEVMYLSTKSQDQRLGLFAVHMKMLKLCSGAL